MNIAIFQHTKMKGCFFVCFFFLIFAPSPTGPWAGYALPPDSAAGVVVT